MQHPVIAVWCISSYRAHVWFHEQSSFFTLITFPTTNGFSSSFSLSALDSSRTVSGGKLRGFHYQQEHRDVLGSLTVQVTHMLMLDFSSFVRSTVAEGPTHCNTRKHRQTDKTQANEENIFIDFIHTIQSNRKNTVNIRNDDDMDVCRRP